MEIDYSYRIYHRKDELDSTIYMEIGPGTYSGKPWQEGSLFIGEYGFEMAEGIVAIHFPAYSHWGINDIPGELNRRIIDDWRVAAGALPSANIDMVERLLHLDAIYRRQFDSRINRDRNEIHVMLNELADECEKFIQEHGCFFILGL